MANFVNWILNIAFNFNMYFPYHQTHFAQKSTFE